MFGSLGFPELIFIFLLALLIFGPKKLPELGRTLGKAMAEFRKATTDLKRTINAELIEQELREADPRKMVRDSLREAKESLEKAVRADDQRAAARRDEPADPTEPPPEPPDPNPVDRTDPTDPTDPSDLPDSPHPGFGPTGAVARGAALEEEAPPEEAPPEEAPRPATGP